MPPVFSRILAGLDLSSTDASILQYIAQFYKFWNTQSLYCVHIMSDFAAPTNEQIAFQKQFDPENPVDERVRDVITKAVQPHFTASDQFSIHIEVIEGKPYEKLLHWTDIKNIDLLVTGHKMATEGSGINARRVARQAKCHLLFVPTALPSTTKHILVPTDFSENALRALQAAIYLSHRLEDVRITVLHVVDLPSDMYYMRSQPERGFTAMLLDTARTTFDKMVETHGFQKENLQLELVENYYQNVAAHLTEFADAQEVDLIIQGANGHSAFENFLYGSVTERLVEKYRVKPILIVR